MYWDPMCTKEKLWSLKASKTPEGETAVWSQWLQECAQGVTMAAQMGGIHCCLVDSQTYSSKRVCIIKFLNSKVHSPAGRNRVNLICLMRYRPRSAWFLVFCPVVYLSPVWQTNQWRVSQSAAAQWWWDNWESYSTLCLVIELLCFSNTNYS